MGVELHFFPDRQQNAGQDEDGGPVLEPVTTVNTRVETRELLQDILLQFTPHVGHGALDLEVNHDWSHDLAVELGRARINLAQELIFLAQTLNHGDMQGQIVGDDELESLADHWQLGAVVITEGRLEHLGQERCPLEVVVDKFLEGAVAVNVAVQVVRQHSMRDAFHTGRQLGRLHLVLGGFPTQVHCLNPVNTETLLIADIDFPSVDGKDLAVPVGDKKSSLVF